MTVLGLSGQEPNSSLHQYKRQESLMLWTAQQILKNNFVSVLLWLPRYHLQVIFV